MVLGIGDRIDDGRATITGIGDSFSMPDFSMPEFDFSLPEFEVPDFDIGERLDFSLPEVDSITNTIIPEELEFNPISSIEGGINHFNSLASDTWDFTTDVAGNLDWWTEPVGDLGRNLWDSGAGIVGAGVSLIPFVGDSNDSPVEEPVEEGKKWIDNPSGQTRRVMNGNLTPLMPIGILGAIGVGGYIIINREEV